MNISEIKNGTILVSNSQWGPTYVQVTDCVTDKWGTHLVCAVLGDRKGEFETVHTVGDVDMKGIGFKLASDDELRRMNLYTNHSE